MLSQTAKSTLIRRFWLFIISLRRTYLSFLPPLIFPLIQIIITTSAITRTIRTIARAVLSIFLYWSITFAFLDTADEVSEPSFFWTVWVCCSSPPAALIMVNVDNSVTNVEIEGTTASPSDYIWYTGTSECQGCKNAFIGYAV